jgi:TPR repeat protein
MTDVVQYLVNEKDSPERDEQKYMALECLRDPANHGSATAQYTSGMLLYRSQCESGTKADLLDAARWIRKAALQGFMDAQYELGEMFRHGGFCNHTYMRFARKYIKRASVQGHVEAVARMKGLRSCVMCGGDDAKLACSLCHRARYCDSWCSKKHWCEGGGVGVSVSGGAGMRHKDTCPRTHVRSRGVTTRKLHGAI